MLSLAAAGAIGSVALGLLLRHRTDAALPFPDAATTAFSLVAQWMATRKWLENWLVWIAVDVVYVAMYVVPGAPTRPPACTRRSSSSRCSATASGGCLDEGGRVRPARVVLIGPECTGKTWLAGELATRYGVPWAPEHAREYVERRGAALTYADVDPIGRGQQAGEDAAIARAEAEGAPLVVLDTDLVSTMVYSRHYYGDCPAWIEEAARRRLGDLYLLHHVDVEWVPDGHQREQPERRVELFARFRQSARGARRAGGRCRRVLGRASPAGDRRRRRPSPSGVHWRRGSGGAMEESLRAELVREIQDVLDAEWPRATAEGISTITDRRLQLAAAVLLVSVVRADLESRQDEHRALEQAVARGLDLPEDEAAVVVRCAEEALDRGVRFPVILTRVSRECSIGQKRQLVERMWRIAFSDAELAGHEEYLVRKVAGQLGLTTADLVETKVRAREDFLREDL